MKNIILPKKNVARALLFTSLFLQTSFSSSVHSYETHVSIDYLYWLPSQTGMSYAIGTDSSFLISGRLSDARDFDQHCDWASGFRLGIDCRDLCSMYDISFQWTRFHNDFSSHDSSSLVIATELLAVNLPLFAGTQASARWQLNFDMFDLNLGFCPLTYCRCAFFPYLGIKGGKINQTQTIQYNNFLNTGTSTLLNAQVVDRNNFYGVGPQIGMDLAYDLGCGFGLVGDLGGALLYGHAHNPTKSSIEDPIGSTPANVTFQFEQDLVIPTLHILLGVNWISDCFQCIDVDLGLGYEVQCFWNTWRNQNSFIQTIFITDAGYGDLTFQGLTAHLGISF